MSEVPIPRDIPLPLPIDPIVLQVLIVIFFLAHIFFVNLMLGGVFLTLFYQIKGLKEKEFDKLAYQIAQTVTVNKSLAVVMGVGPLLVMNVLYTVYFYTANSLTGYAWISIIPLVIIAFLILYLHKYTWHKLESRKFLHIFILLIALLLFLIIPIIFLVNVNVMLFPGEWGSIKGFLSALKIGNVFSRYFHFVAASIAVSCLFFIGYFGREKYNFIEKFETISFRDLKKQLYSIILSVNLAQFLIGPMVLLTLPGIGLQANVIIIILLGASIAMIATLMVWKEIQANTVSLGQNFKWICFLLSFTVLSMGTGRHLFRENTLSSHREAMAKKTQEFIENSKAAKEEYDLKSK